MSRVSAATIVAALFLILALAVCYMRIQEAVKITPEDRLRDEKIGHARRTKADLQLLDSAMDQYALEKDIKRGAHVTFEDLKNYLKPGTELYSTGADFMGDTFGPFTVGSTPLVSSKAFNALSDIADASFWSPFQ